MHLTSCLHSYNIEIEMGKKDVKVSIADSSLAHANTLQQAVAPKKEKKEKKVSFVKFARTVFSHHSQVKISIKKGTYSST